LSLGSFLIYLVENIDDFLIGAIISTPALGIYHNAYSLTHKANYQLAKSVHYGTIPVYTKIANDRLRLKKAFLKAVLLTTIIIFIVSSPVFIFNQEIITFFLGEQWLSAIPLIRPLLIAGIIQSYSMISYTLMLAQKKYAYMNLHLAISLISMVGLMLFLGNKNGLVGAVNAVLISRIISIPLIIFCVRKVLKKK
jgi:O-antigen/teichoic acid export membrane protein